MDRSRSSIGTALAVIALSVGLWTAGVGGRDASALAQPPGPGPGGPPAAAVRARMQRMRSELVQARLDQAAARLEIRASQEPAWNAFAAAVRAVLAPPARATAPANSPNQPEDAAAVLHRRAAAELARAQNLGRLADATARLQAALDPNQREVLNQIVRRQLRRGAGAFGFGMRGAQLRGGAGGFPPGAAFMTRRRAVGPGPGPEAAAPDAGPP